ncbi:MAG: helix-turn-helix domain-containing protein [Elusimicrobiota bacterium]|nr:helix-turn-helix domain-containing protein [Elusimicrobiota bacterium]
MGSEYYSIPEAAAKLGLSRIAVFKKVKKGQLEALRFGRNWAVPAAALEKAVNLKTAVRPMEAKLPPRPVSPAIKQAAVPQPAADSELDSMGWD